MLFSYMQDIQKRKQTSTWCGFPHNLLVPRSTPLNEDIASAQQFLLIAMVNDVDQAVTEGSDGVEHM